MQFTDNVCNGNTVECHNDVFLFQFDFASIVQYETVFFNLSCKGGLLGLYAVIFRQVSFYFLTRTRDYSIMKNVRVGLSARVHTTEKGRIR